MPSAGTVEIMSEMTVTGPKFPAAFPASRVAIAMAIAERFGWVEGPFGRLCRARSEGGDVLSASIEAAADAMARLEWITGFQIDPKGPYMRCPAWAKIPHGEARAAELLAQTSQSGR